MFCGINRDASIEFSKQVRLAAGYGMMTSNLASAPQDENGRRKQSERTQLTPALLPCPPSHSLHAFLPPFRTLPPLPTSTLTMDVELGENRKLYAKGKVDAAGRPQHPDHMATCPRPYDESALDDTRPSLLPLKLQMKGEICGQQRA